MSGSDARTLLDREVAARAEHLTAESVRSTCSFARAEKLLGGEYHGRFLIELLQNAADAWRKDQRSRTERSRVAVILTREPALIVANQGVTLTPEVVIRSLGHIGATTKLEGEAIGHKGIGFKSILEMTSVPEIYSGLQEESPALAVRFHPESALAAIMEASPRWREFLNSEAVDLDPEDPLAAIPVLRYPFWVNELSEDIINLQKEGFDTAIKIPFSAEFSQRHSDVNVWASEIRRAMAEDLSDQILLLLGAFSEITVHDQLAPSPPISIRPVLEKDDAPVLEDADTEIVSIARTGAPGSRWFVARRLMGEEDNLAGEIAVGLRYGDESGVFTLTPATDGAVSAPFHLFFPTKIPSGLPFLLHGYFKVDASRKGFHGANTAHNEVILEELAELVRDVVTATAHDDPNAAFRLVNLVAECSDPEDPLARTFRDRVLGHLDERAWVPTMRSGTSPGLCRPCDSLAVLPRLTRLLTDTFPPNYVHARIGLNLLDERLSDKAIDLISSRTDEGPDAWRQLGDLCRPGELTVWPNGQEDDGFRHFLALVNWLAGEYPAETEHFLTGLRGDPASRLIPVVTEGSDRQLLPLPDPSEGLAGQRSQLVMARVRSTGVDALIPPPELEVAFLPDGLLGNEQEIAQVRPLGIRPFTVDNVLDRLNGAGATTPNPPALTEFVWRLLSRERANQYGTRKAAERARVFDPAEWFWCRPGRAREGANRRLEQQRERYLSSVLLPSRGGAWRPAATLCFGADWADWLEDHPEGLSPVTLGQRTTAYRALEASCPDPSVWLLAPPETVLALLKGTHFGDWDDDDAGPTDEDRHNESEEEATEESLRSEQHAFLLRLGVWETLPIAATEGRERRPERQRLLWPEEVDASRFPHQPPPGGWRFGLEGWSGKRHWAVHLIEDYQFLWPLAEAASKDAKSVARLLHAGSRLYEQRQHATFSCPDCGDNSTRHTAPRTSAKTDGYQSRLARELRNAAWVPVSVDGQPNLHPVAPATAWWLDPLPTSSGLRTSPWRYVPICGVTKEPEGDYPGIGRDLQTLARITTVDDAGASELKFLLSETRRRIEKGELPLTTPVERRSVISLHTMIYERLGKLGADEGKAVLEEVGVLCHRGEALVFANPGDARHDDGTYSSYLRHFMSDLDLATIPRDQTATARALGIPALHIILERDGEDEGTDVTDELSAILADRIPEFVALLAFHSLGTQTITIDSERFRTVARQLRDLRVRRLDDLTIRASVNGVSNTEVLLGKGRSGDIFLEPASPGRPACLFHDFSGDGWQDRLRRKIAPHLASLIGAASYAHTFALFLQAESDEEREDFLLELGISDDAVATVAGHIDVAHQANDKRAKRWFAALSHTLGIPGLDNDSGPDELEQYLVRNNVDCALAQAIAACGGGESARRDVSAGSVLRLLHKDGRDLQILDRALKEQEPSDGLIITDSQRAFNAWMHEHQRRVVTVLAARIDPDRAKSRVRECKVPATTMLRLDVPLSELLIEVAEVLDPGDETLASRLAENPADTMAALGGFHSSAALDDAALLIFDAEEQRRALRERAHRWKAEIRRLAVLVRMTTAETLASVRRHDAEVASALADTIEKPSDLVSPVGELFATHEDLRMALQRQLDDSINGPEPQRNDLMTIAGVSPSSVEKLERALNAPLRQRAERLRNRGERLRDARVTAAVPQELMAAAPQGDKRDPIQPGLDSSKRPIHVAKIKVETKSDQRKRELGDEGEQWALADTVATFLAMDDAQRGAAIADVRLLLDQFEGDATKELLSFAAAAEAPRGAEGDDDDLIAALEGLLHVSRVSDGFGFDIIGWASPSQAESAHAMCVEVKSTTGHGFHLSLNEWKKASDLAKRGLGNRYAVLVVRRHKSGGVPKSMDLLVEPVRLREAGLLLLTEDGYLATYATHD